MKSFHTSYQEYHKMLLTQHKGCGRGWVAAKNQPELCSPDLFLCWCNTWKEVHTPLLGEKKICNMSVIKAPWLIFSTPSKVPARAFSLTKALWIQTHSPSWCFFWLYLQTKTLAQALPRLPLAFYFFSAQSANRAWLVFPCLKVTLESAVHTTAPGKFSNNDVSVSGNSIVPSVYREKYESRYHLDTIGPVNKLWAWVNLYKYI